MLMEIGIAAHRIKQIPYKYAHVLMGSEYCLCNTPVNTNMSMNGNVNVNVCECACECPAD